MVQQMGWAVCSNGELLPLAADHGFRCSRLGGPRLRVSAERPGSPNPCRHQDSRSHPVARTGTPRPGSGTPYSRAIASGEFTVACPELRGCIARGSGTAEHRGANPRYPTLDRPRGHERTHRGHLGRRISRHARRAPRHRQVHRGRDRRRLEVDQRRRRLRIRSSTTPAWDPWATSPSRPPPPISCGWGPASPTKCAVPRTGRRLQVRGRRRHHRAHGAAHLAASYPPPEPFLWEIDRDSPNRRPIEPATTSGRAATPMSPLPSPGIPACPDPASNPAFAQQTPLATFSPHRSSGKDEPYLRGQPTEGRET